MPARSSSPRRSRSGRDPADLVIFAVLALLSVWTLAFVLKRIVVNGEVWTGSDGLHVSDQMQYLAWIRQASQHVLIANPYQLTATSATFLHPGFLVSGVLTALGLAPSLTYLLWQPVAVVSLFLAVRAYVRRVVPSVSGRRAALILALFFVSTAAYASGRLGFAAVDRLDLLAIGFDMWPGTWLWGYSFTVLAVAAIPAALLLYERDRTAHHVGVAAPSVGMLCSWFQPWQGATLLGTLVVTELLLLISERRAGRARGVERRSSSSSVRVRTLPLITATAGATTVPLVYYALLGRSDPSWALASMANKLGAWPAWTILASIAPLALPAALAYRVRPVTFQDIAVRVWPVAALGLYWLSAYSGLGTFPLHFFQGLTIPLAILAVIGVQTSARIRGPLATAAAVAIVALLTVPAVLWRLNDASHSIESNGVSVFGPPNPYFLPRSEARALNYVTRDPRRGGVLTSLYLGQLVPAETGRRTWVGAVSWTPHFVVRVAEAEQLFSGAMSPAQAIAFVRATDARYVIQDCRHHADIASSLAPIVRDVHRFSCASVIFIRP